eukprot:11201350-Lingulodinium_polyedra.AAC.1
MAHCWAISGQPVAHQWSCVGQSVAISGQSVASQWPTIGPPRGQSMTHRWPTAADPRPTVRILPPS